MENCDSCEHYFGQLKKNSPCGQCVNVKWGNGYQKASIKTRLRIIGRRIRRLMER